MVNPGEKAHAHTQSASEIMKQRENPKDTDNFIGYGFAIMMRVLEENQVDELRAKPNAPKIYQFGVQTSLQRLCCHKPLLIIQGFRYSVHVEE